MKDQETEESAWGKNRNYIIKRDTYIERHHQESQRLNENRKKNTERKTQDKKKSKKKNHTAKKKKMTPTRGFAFRLCQTLSAY